MASRPDQQDAEYRHHPPCSLITAFSAREILGNSRLHPLRPHHTFTAKSVLLIMQNSKSGVRGRGGSPCPTWLLTDDLYRFASAAKFFRFTVLPLTVATSGSNCCPPIFPNLRASPEIECESQQFSSAEFGRFEDLGRYRVEMVQGNVADFDSVLNTMKGCESVITL
jgi:hypothetical protein